MMRTERAGTDPSRRALEEALQHFRTGARDLHEAAREAGLPEWDFLEAAQSTPDPMGPGLDKGLRPFVRGRDD